MFRFIKEENLHHEISRLMLIELYQQPNMRFESILEQLDFKRRDKEKLKSYIPLLSEKFDQINTSKEADAKFHWIMGQIRNKAIGNIALTELSNIVKESI